MDSLQQMEWIKKPTNLIKTYDSHIPLYSFKLYLTGFPMLGMTVNKVITYVTIQWKAILYLLRITEI
jgi:hypothetical protein